MEYKVIQRNRNQFIVDTDLQTMGYKFKEGTKIIETDYFHFLFEKIQTNLKDQFSKGLVDIIEIDDKLYGALFRIQFDCENEELLLYQEIEKI